MAALVVVLSQVCSESTPARSIAGSRARRGAERGRHRLTCAVSRLDGERGRPGWVPGSSAIKSDQLAPGRAGAAYQAQLCANGGYT